MTTSIPQQQPTSVPTKASSFTAKDELIFLFLQFQRTLVLSAVAVCESMDKKQKQNMGLKMGTHILDIEDQQQILSYLDFLRSLRKRTIVRLATWIHTQFDRSRNLKNFTITVLLYFRLLVRELRPRKIYGPYDEWVKKLDSPSDAEVSSWSQQIKNAGSFEPISILILPNALSNIEDLVISIRTQMRFQPNWFFYGSSENLELLRQELATAGIPSDQACFTFFKENNFDEDIRTLSQSMNTWIIVQNERGQLAKRSQREIIEWAKSEIPDGELGCDLAYSDSDYLASNQKRFHPKFHANWNLRYFVGQNCFRGLAIIKKSKLLQDLKNVQAANWPELLVHLIQSSPDRRIAHIAKILFHTREAKDPAQALIIKKLSEILEKNHQAHIELNEKKIPHIVWPLPAKLPKVSILIPTKDRADLLSKLVDGLLNHTDYSNIEIVIVDNQSTEEATKKFFEKMKNFSNIKVVPYHFPFNYSAINNFGFKYCTGEILALLNNDIEVIDAHWLKEAIREVLAPKVGIVGAKLYFKNGFIQHAGVVLGSGQVPGHIHGFEHRSSKGFCDRLQFPHELSAVTGACMLMRREVFEEVSGFNEKDLAVAYNDIDLCLRVGELGLKIVWTPNTELYHLESASRPPDRRSEQIVRYRKEVEFMRRRWKKIMHNDPFYNPNLTKEKCNFMVPNVD